MNTHFEPSPEMVKAATAVIIARAYVDSIKPTVEELKFRILQENCFKYAKDKNNGTECIKNISDISLMERNDISRYLAAVHSEYIKAGFLVYFGICPLKKAVDIQRKFEGILLETSELYTNISFKGKYVEPEIRQKMINLLLRLLTPFCLSAAKN